MGFTPGSFAQSLERSVLASGGEVASNAEIMVTYTIGEVVVVDAIVPEFQLLGGFEQPDNEILLSDTPPEDLLDIFTIYPNPASKRTPIKVKTSVGYKLLTVYNAASTVDRVVSLNEEKEFTLDILDLAPGLYLFKFEGEKNGEPVFTTRKILIKD